MILEKQLAIILNSDTKAKEWIVPLVTLAQKYKVDTPNRLAAFLSQVCVESNNLSVLEENLMYSAKGLDKTFAKYFVDAGVDAGGYAKQPEKIANRVYADRMGNGPERTGDGWKYRGRGAIQLTGKDNYSNFAKAVGMTLPQVVDYLCTNQGALESAFWFWNSRNINDAADNGDIVQVSKLVNGGVNGLAERKRRYIEIIQIMNSPSDYVVEPCKIGDRGEQVKLIQRALNVPEDGTFGPTTLMAVKKFQSKNGLTIDGVVGPETIQKLFVR